MAKTDTPRRRARASTEITSTLSRLNVNPSTLVFSSQFHKDVITRLTIKTTGKWLHFFFFHLSYTINNKTVLHNQHRLMSGTNSLVTLSLHLRLSPPALHGNLSRVLILHKYRFSCSHLHVYLILSSVLYTSDRFRIWACHSPTHRTGISSVRVITRLHFMFMTRLSYQEVKEMVVELQMRRLQSHWSGFETHSRHL